MAWQSSTAWTGTDTPVLATVLNGIGADIRTWGGAVDAAGYGLANLASITGASNVLTVTSAKVSVVGKLGIGIGATSPTEPLCVMAAGDAFIRLESSGTGAAGAIIKYRRNTTGAAREYWAGAGVSGLDEWAIYDATAAAYRFSLTAAGNIGIGKSNPGTKLAVAGLPTHADNAAAIAAGRTAGDFYRTSTGVVMVTY